MSSSCDSSIPLSGGIKLCVAAEGERVEERERERERERARESEREGERETEKISVVDHASFRGRLIKNPCDTEGF